MKKSMTAAGRLVEYECDGESVRAPIERARAAERALVEFMVEQGLADKFRVKVVENPGRRVGSAVGVTEFWGFVDDGRIACVGYTWETNAEVALR